MAATFTRGAGSPPADLSELLRRFDRGDFDLVAVGRPLLQDPEWVKKIQEDRESDLRPFDAASLGVYH
jgi:2,4-dienoyl-CoA reductase-like NADH-dependent reductase (Old Yellow Enzyme family)